MIAQCHYDPDFKTFLRPSHQGDAGYDLKAYSDPTIVGDLIPKSKKTHGFDLYKSVRYIEYDTNVKIAPEDAFYSLVYPRSSISEMNLCLANSVGVIDSGYRNSIKVRFKYIYQPEDLVFEDQDRTSFGIKINETKIYKKGDKISQLIWAGHLHPHIEFISNPVGMPISDRSFAGFGSTGL